MVRTMLRITSIGNSVSQNNYTIKDLSPLKGKNFYRLAEIDNSGKITYSNIIVFNFSSSTPAIDVFPNPTHQFVTIGLNDLPVNNNTINVFDMTGKKVLSNSNVSGNAVKLDVQNLQSGTYIVKVIAANGTIVQNRFVIIKN